MVNWFFFFFYGAKMKLLVFYFIKKVIGILCKANKQYSIKIHICHCRVMRDANSCLFFFLLKKYFKKNNFYHYSLKLYFLMKKNKRKASTLGFCNFVWCAIWEWLCRHWFHHVDPANVWTIKIVSFQVNFGHVWFQEDSKLSSQYFSSLVTLIHISKLRSLWARLVE